MKFKRKIKYAWQKIKWGYNEPDMWNLDYTIAVFIVPRLKFFKEKCLTQPTEFEKIEEWHSILDKMIFFF